MQLIYNSHPRQPATPLRFVHLRFQCCGEAVDVPERVTFGELQRVRDGHGCRGGAFVVDNETT